MILHIDTAAKAMELHEPDDTSGFHCRVAGSTDPADVDEVVAEHSMGRMVGPSLWITVSSLRALAEKGGVPDGWGARFEGMVDECGRRGQLNDDRSYIMADVAPA